MSDDPVDPLWDGATQIPAPSNEVSPTMVNVRLDVIPGPHATIPWADCGITKLIWYKPTEVGVSPANLGINGHVGIVEQTVRDNGTPFEGPSFAPYSKFTLFRFIARGAGEGVT